MESKPVQGSYCPHPTPEALLIEPVWNRNSVVRNPKVNRYPFNRTSMESKLTIFRQIIDLWAVLLIEPVWNRN